MFEFVFGPQKQYASLNPSLIHTKKIFTMSSSRRSSRFISANDFLFCTNVVCAAIPEEKTNERKTTIGVKRQRPQEDELDVAPSRYLKLRRVDSDLGSRCPYLDQIDRRTLDFDFEKVCSVSMSNHNVYGCLVCGEFFAGRLHFQLSLNLRSRISPCTVTPPIVCVWCGF